MGWGHGDAAPAAAAECLHSKLEGGMNIDGSCGRGVRLIGAVHVRARKRRRGRYRGPECEVMDSVHGSIHVRLAALYTLSLTV